MERIDSDELSPSFSDETPKCDQIAEVSDSPAAGGTQRWELRADSPPSLASFERRGSITTVGRNNHPTAAPSVVGLPGMPPKGDAEIVVAV